MGAGSGFGGLNPAQPVPVCPTPYAIGRTIAIIACTAGQADDAACGRQPHPPRRLEAARPAATRHRARRGGDPWKGQLTWMDETLDAVS